MMVDHSHAGAPAASSDDAADSKELPILRAILGAKVSPPSGASGHARHARYADIVGQMIASGHFRSDRYGCIYHWNGRQWEEQTNATLQHLALESGGTVAETAAGRREIVELLRARTYTSLIPWGQLADHEVAVENGVVDLRTWTRRPHRPEDYLMSVMPWTYEPAAECPVWRNAIDTWLGTESESALALQEFFGYLCLSHARYKKALLLIGPGDAGKSVVLFVSRILVGEQQTCSLSVEHMDDPQRRAIIKGKRLNVVTELSGKALLADGGFKSIVSTEEPLMLDRKYHDVEMYVPSVKCVIATNELPRIASRATEVLDRFLIIPMKRPIPKEEQDQQLQSKLRSEMPGILMWAMLGARRLIDEGGKFTWPSAADAVLDEWRNDLNPMIEFMKENAEYTPGHREPLARIAEAWGGKPPRLQDKRKVGRWLRDAGYHIEDARPADVARSVVKCVRDWRLAMRSSAEMTDADFENP